jgi:hypothetical protein
VNFAESETPGEKADAQPAGGLLQDEAAAASTDTQNNEAEHCEATEPTVQASAATAGDGDETWPRRHDGAQQNEQAETDAAQSVDESTGAAGGDAHPDEATQTDPDVPAAQKKFRDETRTKRELFAINVSTLCSMKNRISVAAYALLNAYPDLL